MLDFLFLVLYAIIGMGVVRWFQTKYELDDATQVVMAVIFWPILVVFLVGSLFIRLIAWIGPSIEKRK